MRFPISPSKGKHAFPLKNNIYFISDSDGDLDKDENADTIFFVASPSTAGVGSSTVSAGNLIVETPCSGPNLLQLAEQRCVERGIYLGFDTEAQRKGVLKENEISNGRHIRQ